MTDRDPGPGKSRPFDHFTKVLFVQDCKYLF